MARSSDINGKASPGVPLSSIAAKNEVLVTRHLDFLVHAVVQRLFHLSDEILPEKPSPEWLVSQGYCDPVRVFVKQEPHPMRKLDEGRVRLISSVSLVDQLVERVLFGRQNRKEITQWKSIPSKPGMGLSLTEQMKSVFEQVSSLAASREAAEADISGFDWSVQEWELNLDLEVRLRLGNFPPKLEMAARNRFKCFMNSVFQLSNGELISQVSPGLMKSGSYCTSSTNSRIRVAMAYLIGSPWCIAMGDDSVEGYVTNAREKYESLGHICKDYLVCRKKKGELDGFNFCSHWISRSHSYLDSVGKTLYRFLESSNEDLEILEAELGTHPRWGEIVSKLELVGRIRAKQNEERGQGPNEEPTAKGPKEENSIWQDEFSGYTHMGSGFDWYRNAGWSTVN